MKILKVILKIKYLIRFKGKHREANNTQIVYGDVKHPAEFLTRW